MNDISRHWLSKIREEEREKCVHICCWNLWFGNSKVLHGWIGIQVYEFGHLFACILESHQAFGKKHQIQGRLEN